MELLKRSLMRCVEEFLEYELSNSLLELQQKISEISELESELRFTVGALYDLQKNLELFLEPKER